MKVLFRDQSDNTLYAAKICTAGVHPEINVLWFVTADDDDIEIPHISKTQADAYILELYETGKLDLSKHPAYINEDAPQEETCQKTTIEPVKKPFNGIFSPKRKSSEPWEV